mmetsp:Transcript_158324/g.485085  ORF Transcript_158324/g.485085 Transcript_158324/m.485085 type:complete len:214 (-) Transcript_158324:22-663(-)
MAASPSAPQTARRRRPATQRLPRATPAAPSSPARARRPPAASGWPHGGPMRCQRRPPAPRRRPRPRSRRSSCTGRCRTSTRRTASSARSSWSATAAHAAAPDPTAPRSPRRPRPPGAQARPAWDGLRCPAARRGRAPCRSRRLRRAWCVGCQWRAPLCRTRRPSGANPAVPPRRCGGMSSPPAMGLGGQARLSAAPRRRRAERRPRADVMGCK